MAVKAYGTLFKANGATVARVRSIKPFKVSAETIDITTLDSPDEFGEVLAGLATGGEVEVTLEYSATATATLYALFRVLEDFEIVYPDTRGWEFTGYIVEFGDEEVSNGGGIVTQTVKVVVTGKPTQIAA